jgi:SAM-dependent methyltransferase
MTAQIKHLQLTPQSRVADLGCGSNQFFKTLSRSGMSGPKQIIGVDFLAEALNRERPRANGLGQCDAIVADLADGIIPLATASVDAVLASLLISYVRRPARLLSDIRRILRPGGKVVVSCPRRDADLSKIYVEGIKELDPATVRSLFGQKAEIEFGRLQRELLNQGARLLGLEEEGWFHFWDEDELCEMLTNAGFEQVAGNLSFGEPPQVSLAWGIRA